MSASETKIAAAAAAETDTLTSRRAAVLADRILEGASGLAEFAEGLTDAEWATPISESDRRPIGIIVHHVASVYPAEVQIAQAIAGGNAVTDITWEFIANMNAGHADDNAGATRSETIELLRRNSREAADAVRSLTNAELDSAAPFALSFGAPVTAQFVIEDHALRHSWHHLARIRRTLGR
ncbi:MAG: DinB family protein [Pyrinomonadaceae bacterium]